MADLRTALHELADQRAGDVPPPDLWARGVRRQRRRRAAGALGALAALVVVVLSLVSFDPGLVNPAPPIPADVPSSRLHLPDHVYLPDPWMAESDRPPGPLAVLAAAKRSSWIGSSKGWFGVSAVDGSYHWVDLPGIAPDSEAILSPDGTKIGYALGGEPSVKAFSHIVGFAVYDSTTGHVSRWRIPTRHGLQWDAYSAAWTRDSRWFAVYVGQSVTANSSDDYKTVAFPSRGGRFRTLEPGTDLGEFGTAGPHALTWIIDNGEESAVLVNVDQRTRTRVRLDRISSRGPSFSPDGKRFVLIAEGPGPTDRLFVGNTVAPGALARTKLLSRRLQPYAVLGWVDNQKIFVYSHVSGGDGVFFFTVDTRTGEFHKTLRTGGWFTPWLSTPQVASALLGHPFVPGVRPHRGLDPRLPAGGAAAVLVFAVFGAWFWRRCVGA